MGKASRPGQAGEYTFSTAFGPCSLAFGASGLTGVRLGVEPGGSEAPRWVLDLASRLKRHLEGDPGSYADVPLDESTFTAFTRRVYALARQIPAGSTRSYGDLARALGSPSAARAVGGALARNPLLLVVPCHRILGSGGGLGGFSAPGGVATKRRLLELEGARLP